MSNYHGRFQDLEWYGESKDIIVGGAGGIGSWLIFFLSRIGHNLFIYDHDSIDETNMGGQLYPIEDVTKRKVDSIKDTCYKFSNHESITTFDKYEEDSFSAPIMITCFDNMKSRKIMFENWKKQEDREVFIDGRMQAEYFEIYCVTPGLEEKYEETLFDDSEVPDLPCSAKATSHCGALTGSFITSIFNNWCANQKHEGLRELPFKLSFDLPLMMNEIVIPEPQAESIT